MAFQTENNNVEDLKAISWNQNAAGEGNEYGDCWKVFDSITKMWIIASLIIFILHIMFQFFSIASLVSSFAMIVTYDNSLDYSSKIYCYSW